jgi:hypothetical protein
MGRSPESSSTSKGPSLARKLTKQFHFERPGVAEVCWTANLHMYARMHPVDERALCLDWQIRSVEARQSQATLHTFPTYAKQPDPNRQKTPSRARISPFDL